MNEVSAGSGPAAPGPVTQRALSPGASNLAPIMGLETEYGITDLAGHASDPVGLATAVVEGFAQTVPGHRHIRWDYSAERPFEDALSPSHELRESAAVSGNRLADTANVVLPNGGRLYVDHAHPEYASPEVRGAREALTWDRAGEIIADTGARANGVRLFKNNVDGKGASYGTHENYLVSRSVPFQDLVAMLVPFLVTRQIICGAGRVGIGSMGEIDGFQISQRADYIETVASVETTRRRPIVNTRDEPHSDGRRWRRLHLILGDANVLETSTFLKMASTSAVLGLLSAGVDPTRAFGGKGALDISRPVADLRAVSRGISHGIALRDGRITTAIEIQEHYLAVVSEVVPESLGLSLWADVLARLKRDPLLCARDVEWVSKWRLLEAMRERDKLGWDAGELAAFDLQWSLLDDERGIARRLERSGGVDRMTTDREVADAISRPPLETRAHFRGSALARFAPQIVAANWESMTFKSADGRRRRVAMPDPEKGAAVRTRELFGPGMDLAKLLDLLGAA